MTVSNPLTEAKAGPWKEIAEQHLRGKQYTTARKLASKLKVTVSIAGSVLVSLGWRKVSNRVYERGGL